MKTVAPGQIRKNEDGDFYILILDQTEKPGVWFIAPSYGGIERWWWDGIEDFEIVAELPEAQ